VVSLFHVIQHELKYREKIGLPKGFRALEKVKPLVALGADEPLDGTAKSADYFHGRDGLAGLYTAHPHLTPQEAWEHLFETPPKESDIAKEARTVTDEMSDAAPLFTPSSKGKLLHSRAARVHFCLQSRGPMTNSN
jgi:hypothetical protein